MSIETRRQITPVTPETGFRGWSVATIIAMGMFTGGIYGWPQQSENPQSQKCATLTSRAYNLESELFKDGTLGAAGGWLVRYLEIRNLHDSRLLEWGQLKNERDKECAAVRKQDTESLGGFVRLTALLGGILTLVGTGEMIRFWRLLKTSS